MPDSRDAFLRELVPLPSETLVLVYDVEGPAGMTGTLEVLARSGGYRRENWVLHLPLGDAEPRRIAGSMIQTPDAIWTEGLDGAAGGSRRPSPLGPLADAFVASSPQRRSAVVQHLRRWRADLAAGRREQPGTMGTVLGIPCLETRVAGHDLCVWEDTGLPLFHSGGPLEVRAEHIERDVELGASAFEIPAGVDALDAVAGPDPSVTLDRLAAGDLAVLAALLQPGLRIADADPFGDRARGG